MSVTVIGLTELTARINAIRRQIKGGDLGQVASTNLDYNRYVQSAAEQAYIHKGRWQTEEQVAEEEEGNVEREFSQWVERMVTGGGNISDPTKKVLKLLLERMQYYPPPPPASTYRRTGNLRASWQETTFI